MRAPVAAALAVVAGLLSCGGPRAHVSESPPASSMASSVPVDAGVAAAPSDASLSDEHAPSDGGIPHDIVWNWKGTFDFVESGAACPKDCVRYRIVIGTCPGPCRVHVDVDGPHGSQRLEGIAVGTGDRYTIAVRFEGYRGAASPEASLSKGATLFTLEAAPGDHMILAFAALHSGDGRERIITDHVSLPSRR